VTEHIKLNQIRIVWKIKVQKVKRSVKNIAGVDAAVYGKCVIGCIGTFSFP